MVPGGLDCFPLKQVEIINGTRGGGGRKGQRCKDERVRRASPDMMKLAGARIPSQTFSGGKGFQPEVFVYLRLTPRQIEISICNLARGSAHPGNTARGRPCNQSRLIGS